MMNVHPNKTAASLLLSLALLPAASRAEIPASPIPGTDTRLVVFRYDPNNTYTIYTVPGAVTDIQLNSDEHLTALALGDTIQWTVAKTEGPPGHLFIKPVRPDLFTSATVVTNKRAYQLTLRSGKSNGRWYQRVTWEHPEIIMLEEKQAAEKKAADDAEKKRLDDIAVDKNVSIEGMNFDYDIDGDDNIRPRQVFDDGRFTWIRVGKMQELPAIFIIDPEGHADLANYIIKGDFMVVQRLMPKAVLKLGKSEVTITNNKMNKKHGLFHWW